MMTDTEKDLVEIIEGEADELGLPKDPTVSLFGQPLKMLPGDPDAADIAIFVFFPGSYSMASVIDTPLYVRGYMESELKLKREKPELSIKELRQGPFYAQFREPTTNLFYTIAPDPAVLLVVTGKCPGAWQSKAKDYAFALDIYTNDEHIPRGIARYLNALYKGGIVNSTNWAQVQRLFEVDTKKCMAVWQEMAGIEGNGDSTNANVPNMSRFCMKCGERFIDEHQRFCAFCGKERVG